jgi:hypothetical protein
MTPFGLPVRQIAYFVTDVRAAALRHHALFGSGPYYVADHITLSLCRHRGREAVLDHSSAYGQWGSVMIEFVQQNGPGPSAFHDVYPEGSGREGLHHLALFSDDLKGDIARYTAEGHELALYAEMASGFPFAMIDTVAAYGHMIELYPPEPSLTDFYAQVAEAARGFDGTDVLRPISFD